MEIRPLHLSNEANHAAPQPETLSSAEYIQHSRFAFDALRRSSEHKLTRHFMETVVINLDPQYQWVSGLDVAQVHASCTDISTFRQGYYEEHESLPSGWSVYQHFRRAIEVETPSPRDVHTVSLLDALMNGKVRRDSTLPHIPSFFL